MYVGNINQWESEKKYIPDFLVPWISKLAEVDIQAFLPGRHDLGNGNFMNVDEGKTMAAAEQLMEAHEKYVDIQMVISGNEYIGYQPLCNAGECVEWYPESDGYKYAPKLSEDIKIRMIPGATFAVFMPGDGHRALCAPDGISKPIRKVILKIRIS